MLRSFLTGLSRGQKTLLFFALVWLMLFIFNLLQAHLLALPMDLTHRNPTTQSQSPRLLGDSALTQLKHIHQQGFMMLSDGTRIHVIHIKGKGIHSTKIQPQRSLVVLGGLMGHGFTWLDQFALFAQSPYQDIYLLGLPPFAGRPAFAWHGAQMMRFQQAQWIEQALEKLNIKSTQTDFLAHSYGSSVMLELTPGFTKSHFYFIAPALNLQIFNQPMTNPLTADPIKGFDTFKLQEPQAYSKPQPTLDLIDQLGRGSLSLFAQFLNPLINPWLPFIDPVPWIADMIEPTNLPVMAPRSWRYLAHYDAQSFYNLVMWAADAMLYQRYYGFYNTEQLNFNATLLASTTDPITPVSQMQWIKQINPNTRLYLIEKTGHLPHVEQPGAVNQLLNQLFWLDAKSWLN